MWTWRQWLPLVGVCALVTGCEPSGPSPFAAMDQMTITVDVAGERADEYAAKMLADAMVDPHVKMRPVASDGTALTLEDYSKHIRVSTWANRPRMTMLYRCKRPLGYSDGWEHFTVTVLLDTGETEVRGGGP